MLILPMLAHAFQNSQSWEVVDPGIIKTIVDKLLDPPEEVSLNFFHLYSFKEFLNCLFLVYIFFFASKAIKNLLILHFMTGFC